MQRRPASLLTVIRHARIHVAFQCIPGDIGMQGVNAKAVVAKLETHGTRRQRNGIGMYDLTQVGLLTRRHVEHNGLLLRMRGPVRVSSYRRST